MSPTTQHRGLLRVLLLLLKPTGHICHCHPFSLGHRGAQVSLLKGFSALMIKNTVRLEHPVFVFKIMFYGPCNEVADIVLGIEQWASADLLCLHRRPEGDFWFIKFMLARKVVFVDTGRPSGLHILNLMSLFKYIFKGNSIFFDMCLPN